MCNKDLLTNGECDDETNDQECFYDFGDCCKFQIHVGECTDCICHEDKTRHTFWMYPNELQMCENPKSIGIFFDKLFEASGIDTKMIGKMTGTSFVLDFSACWKLNVLHIFQQFVCDTTNIYMT